MLAGGAASIANEKLREAHVAEHVEKGKELGKEYTAKSWNFMKGVYANVASQVESVARENGYKVDLGQQPCHVLSCCLGCEAEQHQMRGACVFSGQFSSVAASAVMLSSLMASALELL